MDGLMMEKRRRRTCAVATTGCDLRDLEGLHGRDGPTDCRGRALGPKLHAGSRIPINRFGIARVGVSLADGRVVCCRRAADL